MKPEYYSLIKATLETASGIGDIGLWTDKMADQVDQIRRFPVALIEFVALEYHQMVDQVQECNTPTIVVHLLHDTIETERAVGVFTISQAVFTAMNKEGWRRKREESRYRGDGLIEWLITFEGRRYEDHDAVPDKLTITAPDIEPQTHLP